MPKPRVYTFKINAFAPDTIPMSRLAAYLSDLATLLGEYDSVHFVKLKKGSTGILHSIQYEAEPKVRERVNAVRYRNGPRDAMNAARNIDKRLAADHASGRILEPAGSKIIEFPGWKRFSQPIYGPFNQPGIVDGVPIRVGGEEDIVPVHLEEPGQERHICQANRAVAHNIGAHLFTAMIRAEGIGRWYRDADGIWIRKDFTIQDFKVIDETTPLSQVVEKLRAIPSEIREVEDPLAELEEIRHGGRG